MLLSTDLGVVVVILKFRSERKSASVLAWNVCRTSTETKQWRGERGVGRTFVFHHLLERLAVAAHVQSGEPEVDARRFWSHRRLCLRRGRHRGKQDARHARLRRRRQRREHRHPRGGGGSVAAEPHATPLARAVLIRGCGPDAQASRTSMMLPPRYTSHRAQAD